MATKTEPKALDLYREKGVPAELTFDAMLGKLREQGDLADPSILSDGFTLLKDKEQLVGRPFLALSWTFRQGDMGEYCSVELVTAQNERLVINDGSTGVCAQLRKLTDEGEDRALLVTRGLRVSEYEKEIGGKVTKARTFYLDV